MRISLWARVVNDASFDCLSALLISVGALDGIGARSGE